MKKSKKGFTLIELLAVIVILAVIALIATPIVLKLIERAKQGAAQNSAYGVKKAAELYYSTILVTNPEGFSSDVIFSCNGNKCEANVDNDKDSVNDYLDIDGTIPSSGKVTVKKDGNILYNNLVINNFNCTYNDNKFKCTKSDSSNTVTVGDIVTTVNSITIPFNIDDANDALALSDNFLSNMVLDIELNSSISVKCEYGTTEQYGKEGILGNNSCLLPNLDANTNYYYRITYTNSNGKKYEQSGSANTNNYAAGEVVYFNPITGKACYNYNNQNSITGYNGENDSENQNGCMKWYIVSINNDFIELIVDHNITYDMKWDDVSNYLISSTSSWKDGLNPKLISPDIVANITGASSNSTIKWNSSKVFVPSPDDYELDTDIDTKISWFYLDGSGTTYNRSLNGWQFKTATTANASKFSWLFDNTYNCLSSGCSKEDNNYYPVIGKDVNDYVLGYYTNTKFSFESVDGNEESYDGSWIIIYSGVLGTTKDTVARVGIRPVITIEKKDLTETEAEVDFDMDSIPPTVTLSLTDMYFSPNTIKIEISDNLSDKNQFCVTPINDSSNCKFTNTLINSDGTTDGIGYATTIISDKTYYVFAKDEVGNISEGYPIYLPKVQKYDNSDLDIPQTYTTGTIDEVSVIYFDPAENEFCSVEDYENNIENNRNYMITNGCLKWYAIENSSEDSQTVDVILDHNIYLDSYNSYDLYLPSNYDFTVEFRREEINDFFQMLKDYAGWKVEPKLISANTIAQIVGADSNDTLKWSSSKTYGNGDDLNYVSWIYLDGSGNSYSGWQNQIANSTNKSQYSWLFDNLSDCEEYGCMYLPEYSFSDYLTSDTSLETYGHYNLDWVIYNNGTLTAADTGGNGSWFGLRPVITIQR